MGVRTRCARVGLALVGIGFCWASPTAMGDMSYTVTLTQTSKDGQVETLVQRCKLKGSKLHSISEIPGTTEEIEQILDFEKGTMLLVDRAQKTCVMVPVPEDVGQDFEGDVTYEVQEAGTIQCVGKPCRVVKVRENRNGRPWSEMELAVWDDVHEDLAGMWKMVLQGLTGPQQELRDSIRGFPLHYKRVGLGDGETQILDVTDLRIEELPEKDFIGPKDFAIQRLPATPSGPVEKL